MHQTIHKLADKHLFYVFLILIIMILSLAPFQEMKMTIQVPFYDKWTHMLMYGTLSATFRGEQWLQHRKPKWTALLMGSLVFPILMGGLMELAQAYLTTNRSGDWMDVAANSVGAALAYLLGLFLPQKKD